jgi:hypothetical protein
MLFLAEPLSEELDDRNADGGFLEFAGKQRAEQDDRELRAALEYFATCHDEEISSACCNRQARVTSKSERLPIARREQGMSMRGRPQ